MDSHCLFSLVLIALIQISRCCFSDNPCDKPLIIQIFDGSPSIGHCIPTNDTHDDDSYYCVCPALESVMMALSILNEPGCNVTVLIPSSQPQNIYENVYTIKLASFRLAGVPSARVQCNSDPNGFTNHTILFLSSDFVKIENITWLDCSLPVGFEGIATVQIQNLIIRNFGEAALDIFNCHTVFISNSHFCDNRGSGISKIPFRGNTGAVSIGFSNFSTHYECDSPIHVEVTDSYFINNSANADATNFRTTSHAFFRGILTGRAGGLGVFIYEDFCNVSISVTNCAFENNFAQSYGGGLYFVYSGNETSKKAHFKGIVTGTNFIGNKAGYGAGGFIASIQTSGPHKHPHIVQFESCLFQENVASLAGGMYYYVIYQGGAGNHFILSNTTFNNNYIEYRVSDTSSNTTVYNSTSEDHPLTTDSGFGSALAASIYHDFRALQRLRHHLIRNCNFVNNTGSSSNSTVVSIGYLPFNFTGQNVFSNNSGSVILRVIGTKLLLEGEIEFSWNTAPGAILQLISFAQIVLNESVSVIFEENKGRDGGAIVVGSFTQPKLFQQLPHNPQCFLLSSDHKKGDWMQDKNNGINLTFTRNSALFGAAIYVESNLSLCSWVFFPNNTRYFNPSYFPHRTIFHLEDNSNLGAVNGSQMNEVHSIVTDAVSYNISKEATVKAYWPGQKISLNITPIDQLGNPTGTSLKIQKWSDNPINNLIPNAFVVNNQSALTNFTYTLLNKSKQSGLSQKLSLTPIVNSSLEAVKTSFEIKLHPCLPGYNLVNTDNNSGYKCECNTNITEIFFCEEGMIIIRPGLWANASSTAGSVHFHPCPPNYCACQQPSVMLMKQCVYGFNGSNPNQQCNGRKGILCGECEREHYRTLLMDDCNSTCEHSRLISLGYFGFIVPIYILVTLILLLIDKPIPSLLHPMLFYIQITPITTFYFLSKKVFTSAKYLYFVSSFVGFYLPYDFCLKESSDIKDVALMIHMLRSFIPLAVVFGAAVILLLIKFMCGWTSQQRYSMYNSCLTEDSFLCRISSYFRRPLKMHGVWCVFLMLFPNTLYNALRSLYCPKISTEENSSSLRWFLDGSVKCFEDPQHLVTALISISIGLLLTLLLITVGVVNVMRKKKYSELPRWIEKLVEAASSYFVMKHSNWAIVDVVSKSLIIVMVVFLPGNKIALLLCLSIFIVIATYFNPYHGRMANCLLIVVLSFNVILLSLESENNHWSYTMDDKDTSDLLIAVLFVPLIIFSLALCGSILGWVKCVVKGRINKMRKILKQREQENFHLQSSMSERTPLVTSTEISIEM